MESYRVLLRPYLRDLLCALRQDPAQGFRAGTGDDNYILYGVFHVLRHTIFS